MVRFAIKCKLLHLLVYSLYAAILFSMCCGRNVYRPKFKVAIVIGIYAMFNFIDSVLCL